MANYLLGTCNFVFDAGWQFATQSPTLCDIKLFPDDPYGSPNAHGVSLFPGTYPIGQWSCWHQNGACRASTADGYVVRCEQVPGFGGTYSDPPMNPPWYLAFDYNSYVTFEQGKGLVEPTMIERGVTNPQGQYPMNRVPIRSYHNGMYSDTNANRLPKGWYIWLRFYNRYNGGVAAYATPIFRFQWSMTLVPGGGGNNCLGAGCRSYPNRHYINDEALEAPYWFFANQATSKLYPLTFNLNGYTTDHFKYNFLATSNYISSNTFVGRTIYNKCSTSCL
jgi:hypothetical protein